MRLTIICVPLFSLLISQPLLAGTRPLLPGEQTVYQTVQSGTEYRTNWTQITGNAYTNYGDEIILAPGTNRYITNISVATQTFDNAATPAYMDGVNSQPPTPGFEDFGGFLELSIYLNDGAFDGPGDPFVEATPATTQGPGTLVATSRIPTPVYPAGGTSRDANGLNDPNNPADNGADPWVVNFPFPAVLVPDRFTFAVVNLNRFGVPDGFNFDGNQFGLWHGRFSTSNVDPDANPATHNNNTTFNTNHVGTSRTGSPPHTLANPGHWTWIQYNGPRVSPTPWESDRDVNTGPEATIYALAVPEPSSMMLAFSAACAMLLAAGRRSAARRMNG